MTSLLSLLCNVIDHRASQPEFVHSFCSLLLGKYVCSPYLCVFALNLKSAADRCRIYRTVGWTGNIPKVDQQQINGGRELINLFIFAHTKLFDECDMQILCFFDLCHESMRGEFPLNWFKEPARWVVNIGDSWTVDGPDGALVGNKLSAVWNFTSSLCETGRETKIDDK